MKRNQLLILVVLVVVLGGAGILLKKRGSSVYENSSGALGKKVLGDFPVNDVGQISLKQGTNEVTLAKKADLWRVKERNDYPANYSEISDFLLKARDLKIVQSEKVGPSQLARFQLVPGSTSNSAMTAEFRDQGGKVLRSLLLGKKHMRKSNRPSSPFGDMGEEGWPDGRYVKAGSDSDTVALVSEPLANVEPRPENWLNKDFFKVDRVKSVAMTSPTVTNSWKVARTNESAEWTLAEAKPGEQLDTGKVSSFSSQLSSPTFNDVAPESKAAEYGVEKGSTLILETFDDFTYTLKAANKTNDLIPLTMSVSAKIAKDRTAGKDEKPEDKDKLDKEFKEKQKKLEDKLNQEKGYEKWVFLVNSWTLDPLLKSRHELMAEKKEEKKEETGTNAPVVSNIVSVPPATNPPATTNTAPATNAVPSAPATNSPAVAPATNSAASTNK